MKVHWKICGASLKNIRRFWLLIRDRKSSICLLKISNADQLVDFTIIYQDILVNNGLIILTIFEILIIKQVSKYIFLLTINLCTYSIDTYKSFFIKKKIQDKKKQKQKQKN
jgi:hypothetical protein